MQIFRNHRQTVSLDRDNRSLGMKSDFPPSQIHQIVVCYPSVFLRKTHYKLRQTLCKHVQASGCTASHSVVVWMSQVLPQDQEFEYLVPTWWWCLGRSIFAGRGWDAGLLEEIHHRKHAFSVHSHTPLTVCSPCLVIVVEDVTSQILFLLLCTPNHALTNHTHVCVCVRACVCTHTHSTLCFIPLEP